ncbi:MAG TPA: GtrA family protein [Acidimicrobiales bacterium]
MAKSRAEVLARIREADYRKMLKYSAVSAVAFPFTQVMLLVFTVGLDWSFVKANLVAVTIMAFPAYLMNRYWVWGKKDKNRFMTEVLPFWIITLIGLVLSTICAHYAEQWFAGSELAVNVANAVGFGLVWVFKFVFLDRLMFGNQMHFPPDEELDAELDSAPAV